MKKLILVLGFSGLMSISFDVNAQCSMCRQAAASNIEAGQKQGSGLNRGILFLMAVPYLLGGTAGVIYWKNRKRIKSMMS
jgi:hypothetical protein